MNLANLLRDQHFLDEAIEHYRQAASYSPLEDLRPLRGLAEASVQRDGTHAAVIAYLEEESEHAPRSPATHTLLGHFLRLDGKLDLAIESYRRALALDPENQAMRRNLDDALADRPRPPE